jgi:2-polyprenyl-3-methyl-5-hydroxy-6-metoxy-1,4-benzoquinol methylase
MELDFWARSFVRFDKKVHDDLSNAPDLLADIPLSVFGAALLHPDHYFPRAQSFLPSPASEKIQKAWTGSSGELLLETSVAFVQQQLGFFAKLGCVPLAHARILDFGIGWGRIARLWLKYLPPSSLCGCDAWDRSLALAAECQLQNRIVKSDKYLERLPYDEAFFDHIYAMSIFTHLNEEAFTKCLKGLLRMLKPNGFVLITVRPSLFWSVLRPGAFGSEDVASRQGFIFCHGSQDPDFGDCTADPEWLKDLFHSCGCTLSGIEWSPADAMQVILCLRKAP